MTIEATLGTKDFAAIVKAIAKTNLLEYKIKQIEKLCEDENVVYTRDIRRILDTDTEERTGEENE